jgi:hypothetical protein
MTRAYSAGRKHQVAPGLQQFLADEPRFLCYLLLNKTERSEASFRVTVELARDVLRWRRLPSG